MIDANPVELRQNEPEIDRDLAAQIGWIVPAETEV